MQNQKYGGSVPFTTLPNELIRGGHGGNNMMVLLTILSHGVCWASAETISKEVGCSRRTVYEAIRYWKENGEKYGVSFEETSRDGDTTIYQIVIHMVCHKGTGGVQPAHGGCAAGAHLPVQPAHTKKNPIKNNPEEGLAVDKAGDKPKRQRPYLEGDPAWQDPDDANHWRVKTHSGEWREYAGNVKEKIKWR